MFVYVLELQQGKFYIGKTNNIQSRLQDHDNGLFGSAWTKIYRPKKLLETIQDSGFAELTMTLKYMQTYGIDNVRGADYCNVILTKEQKKEINGHICAEEGRCYSCGGDHYVSECPEKDKSFFSCFSCLFSCFSSRSKDEYVAFDSADHVVQFGKHKGLKYTEVVDNHYRYCKWVMAQQSSNPSFVHFQNWLRSRV